MLTLPAIPPGFPERQAKTRLLRLVLPYFRRVLHRVRTRTPGESEDLPPSLENGPFGYLVLGLDGLPIARGLRESIDLAWSSEIPTRRAKALAIAVVARGIGCPHAEREVGWRSPWTTGLGVTPRTVRG
jgi:hypothetical protein